MKTENIILEEDEYINPEDGLIWCKKCNTPRQIVKECLGKDFNPRVLCDCQLEKVKEKEKLLKEEEKNRRISRLKDAGLGWEALHEMRFENDNGHNPRVMDIVKDLINRSEEDRREGLLLWGPSGTGKTFAAACAVNSLLEKEKRAGMYFLRQIITKAAGMSYSERDAYLEELFRKKLLCIDDFNLKYHSKHSEDLIMDLVSRMDRSKNPVIITSNYSMAEMENPQNDLEEYTFKILLSRLVPVRVDGPDLRKEKSKQQYMQLKKELEDSKSIRKAESKVRGGEMDVSRRNKGYSTQGNNHKGKDSKGSDPVREDRTANTTDDCKEKAVGRQGQEEVQTGGCS